MEILSRSELLLGHNAMARLSSARVAVFGIGGVGSYAAEALVRGGIGFLSFCDSDDVSPSNINRQLIATTKTIGRKKVEVMKERALEINPQAEVEVHPFFYQPETSHLLPLSSFDYIVDAIDTVSSKLLLIEEAYKAGTPVISCMGAGNKLDPSRFEVDDIFHTSVCPLARVMRRELKARGIPSLKVVYSKEEPLAPIPPALGEMEKKGTAGRPAPGSVSFVPSVAGLILAGEVIKDLCRTEQKAKKAIQ